eukprot:TRINITY_DN11478_c0_g1_i1.p1 TRINITY_DN11478_c0_g1~~TRINITY_DN11478_c0_g1_i1.p1  ORF type:complete len:445 (+),score=121.64 TRINITY_DN11478_c0_g1_i1:466-1800(+)
MASTEADAMITDTPSQPAPSASIASYPPTTESLVKATEVRDTDPGAAIAIYRSMIDDESASPEALRNKETAISNLATLLSKQGKAEELRSLLTDLRAYFALIPKAKTAKIVRTIIDEVSKVPDSTRLQVELCQDMVQWTRDEKRTFLRQRVEARLAALYMELKEYKPALSLIDNLVKEVRRLDDKALLIDIDLLESRLHHQLRNLSKAKAALTAARTAGNAIYVPPVQQGQIDMQSGILHAEEKDYKTAYSYFFEAFECLNALDDPKAVLALKYMLLCKVMTSQADEVVSVISTKAGLKYQGLDVEAMKAVADAYSKRSLKSFEDALESYKEQLADDPIISRHLAALYGTLLEQNLVRILEPYSKVEIAFIAEKIGLPIQKVEAKLSQMILDRKFEGTLDQGAGCLLVFDDIPADSLYPSALSTIENMSKVVDSLYQKSTKIMG